MIVYKDYVTFNVMGREFNIISDETSYGRNTVVESNNQYYYMRNDLPDVATAIYVWQKLNNRELSNEEFNQVMIENNLISSAI